jgi:hypothetical protein
MRAIPLLLLLASLSAACGSSSDPVPGTMTSRLPIGIEGGISNIVQPPGSALLNVGDNGVDASLVAIFGFDLTGLGPVTTAELRLTGGGMLGDPTALDPLVVDHIDAGGSLDFPDKTVPALVPAAFMLPNVPAWTLDVTALVNADIAAGRTHSSFRVRYDVPTDGDGVIDTTRIVTSSHADLTMHPVLEVTYPGP